MTQETKEQGLQSDLDGVLAALTSNDHFLVVAHENPDGDALGSMLAMCLGLREHGKDALMYLSGSAAMPAEFGFMDLTEVLRELPEDARARVFVAVDCANARRIGQDASLVDRAKLVIDVDHHHDNTRFGAANLIVADASSTAEIVRDLLWELGVGLTPEIAEALYVGLVTDTGRFQYSNTTPKALRLAAELVEAGADVHGIFRSVYETVQFAKLKLLARALDRAKLYEGGRLLVSYLLRTDFEEVGAEEPYSEGIIDYLRQAEGAQMVALIREPPGEGGPTRRISLRSSQDEMDVSAVARKSGGGGHRQAAGFSSELSIDEIAEFIRLEFVAATDGNGGAADAAAREETGRRRAARQAGGPVVVRARRRPPAPDRREDRPHRNARPVRDRPARAAVRRGDPPRAVLRRPRQALCERDRPDRDDDDRRSRGRGRRAARRARGRRAR